jgi:hypothetical protein
MGQVSLQEDEIERRGGDPIVASRPPHNYPGLVRQEIPPAALEHLLSETDLVNARRFMEEAEKSHRNMVDLYRPAFPDNLSKLFKQRKKRNEALTSLIRLLAPKIRQLRDGERKRGWQKTIAGLKRWRGSF